MQLFCFRLLVLQLPIFLFCEWSKSYCNQDDNQKESLVDLSFQIQQSSVVNKIQYVLIVHNHCNDRKPSPGQLLHHLVSAIILSH
mmetsp:Transcript_1026/g.2162  ORF Transcript_1026/g.2162 Transcript_1026/m.2162 type:complete len:85 (+) Transcript_1026:886-1140(+)